MYLKSTRGASKIFCPGVGGQVGRKLFSATTGGHDDTLQYKKYVYDLKNYERLTLIFKDLRGNTILKTL